MYFKNELSSWDDIRAFQSVAETSGLAPASKITGISAPTLGRRILRLEQELGVVLFDKHQTGYQLTPTGNEFLYYTRKIKNITAAINMWQKGQIGTASVKISAGHWTAWFISLFANTLFKDGENVQIELITDTGYVDLLRREANIGIHNKRAKHRGL
ncbi:MAG: LysR family transcriptional regulator, partial [Robiginitomaculum sp.]|nr:LysR family transcriptional regulator [Robiginitomaculum sp.]